MTDEQKQRDLLDYYIVCYDWWRSSNITSTFARTFIEQFGDQYSKKNGRYYCRCSDGDWKITTISDIIKTIKTDFYNMLINGIYLFDKYNKREYPDLTCEYRRKIVMYHIELLKDRDIANKVWKLAKPRINRM